MWPLLWFNWSIVISAQIWLANFDEEVSKFLRNILRNWSEQFLQVRKWTDQQFSERFYWHDCKWKQFYFLKISDTPWSQLLQIAELTLFFQFLPLHDALPWIKVLSASWVKRTLYNVVANYLVCHISNSPSIQFSDLFFHFFLCL